MKTTILTCIFALLLILFKPDALAQEAPTSDPLINQLQTVKDEFLLRNKLRDVDTRIASLASVSAAIRRIIPQITSLQESVEQRTFPANEIEEIEKLLKSSKDANFDLEKARDALVRASEISIWSLFFDRRNIAINSIVYAELDRLEPSTDFGILRIDSDSYGMLVSFIGEMQSLSSKNSEDCTSSSSEQIWSFTRGREENGASGAEINKAIELCINHMNDNELSNKFDSLKAALTSKLNSFIESLKKREAAVNSQILALEQASAAAAERLTRSTSFDSTELTWTMVAFSFLILAIMLVPKWYPGKAQETIFEKGLLLEVQPCSC
jgi:LPS O-antigen subunit length determinant protein (WzzB/FepE family)